LTESARGFVLVRANCVGRQKIFEVTVSLMQHCALERTCGGRVCA
jgi:hypothetical protein